MSKTDPNSVKYSDAIADDELPIQLTNDALGCPRCRVELTNRKSRVFIDGTTIGMFDSLACEFCGFFLLTEKGFDESAKIIKLFGLDIPRQDNAPVHRHDEGNKHNMESDSFITLERAWLRLTSIYPNESLLYKQVVLDKIGRDEWDTSPRELPPLSTSPPPTNKLQHS